MSVVSNDIHVRFRLKPLAEYSVKYIAFKIRNRTRTLRSSAPAENQLAMAEFSPVKSPVFGMELVPFSCSKTALRSRLIAERNTFESGFKECGSEYEDFELQIFVNILFLIFLVLYKKLVDLILVKHLTLSRNCLKR